MRNSILDPLKPRVGDENTKRLLENTIAVLVATVTTRVNPFQLLIVFFMYFFSKKMKKAPVQKEKLVMIVQRFERHKTEEENRICLTVNL